MMFVYIFISEVEEMALVSYHPSHEVDCYSIC